MEIRQDYVVCNVCKHGKFHVSDIHVCPECYSSNIGNMHDVLNALQLGKEGRGTYWCRDCGCEFDEKTKSRLTRTGHLLSRILYAAHTMFSVIASVSFIVGLILSIYTLTTYKCETPAYMLFSILLLIVVPILSLIISHLIGSMYINIFEDDTQKEVS